jgi:hypothetical protein
MNISGIKGIVYQAKIFGIWSLFIMIRFIPHQIVHTEMNTAVTYSLALPNVVESLSAKGKNWIVEKCD